VLLVLFLNEVPGKLYINVQQFVLQIKIKFRQLGIMIFESNAQWEGIRAWGGSGGLRENEGGIWFPRKGFRGGQQVSTESSEVPDHRGTSSCRVHSISTETGPQASSPSCSTTSGVPGACHRRPCQSERSGYRPDWPQTGSSWRLWHTAHGLDLSHHASQPALLILILLQLLLLLQQLLVGY